MKHLVWLLPLAACAAPPPPCAVGTPAVSAQLLFGRSIKGGGTVDDAAWRGFLAQSVTPRFPDGLTVLMAHGQWRDRASGRIVREPASVVEIVTEPGPGTAGKLAAIRAEYRAAFHQDSVGLVLNQSCASF